MVSPVVDQIRQKLSNLQWARAGLGLPVVSYKFVALKTKTILYFGYFSFVPFIQTFDCS